MSGDAHHITCSARGRRWRSACDGQRAAPMRSSIGESGAVSECARDLDTPRRQVPEYDRDQARVRRARRRDWRSAPTKSMTWAFSSRPRASWRPSCQRTRASAIRSSRLPPRSTNTPDPGLRSGLCAAHAARPMKIDIAMSNSFGFGRHQRFAGISSLRRHLSAPRPPRARRLWRAWPRWFTPRTRAACWCGRRRPRRLTACAAWPISDPGQLLPVLFDSAASGTTEGAIPSWPPIRQAAIWQGRAPGYAACQRLAAASRRWLSSRRSRPASGRDRASEPAGADAPGNADPPDAAPGFAAMPFRGGWVVYPGL